MGGIFGIIRLDGRPLDGGPLNVMAASMDGWGPVRDTLIQGPAGLGWAGTAHPSGARGAGLPLTDRTTGLLFTASGRIDNGDGVPGLPPAGRPPDGGTMSPLPGDGGLLFRAYLEWGEDCPARLYGDWSFAAWHSTERRLFLARDHSGNTALYYHAAPGVFAFASSRKALLALNLAPVEMDELYLAHILVSWLGRNGERTIHSPLKRLPPAHCLTMTPARVTTRRYWRLEDTTGLRLPGRADYAEAMREIFDEAVRCRLRSDGEIALSLSGGLDSGSVAVTAAPLLREKGRRLRAFTSAPLWDTGRYVRARFGDEYPLALAVARHGGNVDLEPVRAERVTPIGAIRRMLAIMDEPGHGTANAFWTQAIREAARDRGCGVLFNGAAGNGSASWTGSVFSQSLGFQVRTLGWGRWMKESAKRHGPRCLIKAWRARRTGPDGWRHFSAIHPGFSRRLGLWDRYMDDPELHFRDPFEERCAIVLSNLSVANCTQAEMGAAYGLDVRDPFADPRVLAFTFSVPDHIFMDPETGLDRWLIREAMKGRLPDEVRLNRGRGRQAGDLVPRLRASAEEVETALDELEAGPAAAYVDVPYMRRVWAMVRIDDTPEAFGKSVTILTRGIMAGLWVNGFHNGP